MFPCFLGLLALSDLALGSFIRYPTAAITQGYTFKPDNHTSYKNVSPGGYPQVWHSPANMCSSSRIFLP